MAAKVKWDRGAWWVITHYHGKRKKRRVGPTKSDKREADEIARKVNAALTLGAFPKEDEEPMPVPCNQALRRWHSAYSPTLKPATVDLTEGIIENHLVPYFGSRDLRGIRESDLLAFIRRKLDEGLAPKTIGNSLSVLRRVLTLLVSEGVLDRNPASRVGELIRRVDRAAATETEEADYWTRAEVEKLLATARQHEPRFAPFLFLLFSTGLRRGEALGLHAAYVGHDGAAGGEKRALGGRRPGPSRSGPHAARVRSRDPRGRDGPVVRRLRQRPRRPRTALCGPSFWQRRRDTG